MKTKRQTKKRKNKKCTKTLKVRRLSYKRKTRQRKTCKRRVYQLGGETHQALSRRYMPYDLSPLDTSFPIRSDIPPRVSVKKPANDVEKAKKLKKQIDNKYHKDMSGACKKARPDHENCKKWRENVGQMRRMRRSERIAEKKRKELEKKKNAMKKAKENESKNINDKLNKMLSERMLSNKSK